MRSFKSNENIHKKEGGSYYVVSANKASSVTLQSPDNESQAFLVQIWYSNVSCDLENMVKITKIQQLNSSIPITYPYEFDQNPPISSLNRTQTTGNTSTNADANRSAPKAICPPPFMLGDI